MHPSRRSSVCLMVRLLRRMGDRNSLSVEDEVVRQMHFRLKTIFVVIALLAVYLSWRMRDPEARTLSAIHEAGGKVHCGYQQPWMGSTKFISFHMLPGYEYYSQHDLTCLGAQTPPELSLVEILLGNSNVRRINAVTIPIGEVTPQMEKMLVSLAELRYLVLEMPAKFTSDESPEALRLRELRATFGGRVWPTVNLGM